MTTSQMVASGVLKVHPFWMRFPYRDYCRVLLVQGTSSLRYGGTPSIAVCASQVARLLEHLLVEIEAVYLERIVCDCVDIFLHNIG